MAALTATATCTGFRAVEEATGELVPGRLLAERVGFLTTLIQAMSTSVVATRWTDADLAALEVGVGPDGRALPARGWMALRRLGWAAVAPEGVYVSDRVRRVAEEDAARVLRLAVYRRAVVHAIVGTWPADPRRRSDAEWGVLRGRLPHVVSNAELRNRTRQVRAFKADHGGRLPAGLTELEAAPRTGGMVLLAAADKQLVTIQRTGAHAAVLRVQLPLTARPTSPTQWAWHAIRLAVPEHTPAEASLCVPTLRVVGGRVRVDLPWRVPAPSAPRAGHTVALGLDWGVNTLLTGTVGKLADTPTGTRVVTDGRMLRFDTTGISAKLHRLRGNREKVAARRDHYARLLVGLPASDPSRQRVLLQAKHAVLAAEHQRSCDRIRHLNHALAWAAARWTVDQAHALGATAIYVEDLATLEARGRRNGNARLSGQVRGTVVAAARHLATKAGVATVTVPARGTSKVCPRCGKALRHAQPPTAPVSTAGNGPSALAAGSPAIGITPPPSGSSPAGCSPRPTSRPTQEWPPRHNDGRGGQRRSRSTPQAPHSRRSTRQPPTGRAAPDACPGYAGEHRPTPTRPVSQPSRRVPDRRAVPAPAAIVAGKRPAGQAPQTHHRRSAVARSGPARDLLACPGRPRPGNRWGFHRNVTATPILPLRDFGPATTRPRPARNT